MTEVVLFGTFIVLPFIMKKKQHGKALFAIFKHEDIFKKDSGDIVFEDTFEPKRRDIYTVIFSGTAGATHFVDNKPVEIPPFSVLFVGADRRSHFADIPQKGTHILIFCSLFYSRTSRDVHFLQNCILFQSFNTVYFLTPPEDAINYCRTLAHLLYDVQQNFDHDLYRDLSHNIIQQILIMGTLQHHHVTELHYKEDIDTLVVIRFKELLEKHYIQEKSSQFYADKLNITRTRLNKATKKILDNTAKELIIKKIIEEAQWQLAYTDTPIKEISAALGFAEEHNFSAFFLKQEGIRPTQFRQQAGSLADLAVRL